MKKLILILLTLTIYSCSSNKTLETYFIENEDNQDIVIVDVPVNLVKNVKQLSKDEQKALKSVKKLNVLYLKKEANNVKEYEKNKAELKQILSNNKYQTLTKFKNGSTKIDVKFVGTDTAIDEVVLFATDKKRGFLIARLLGKNMNPDNLQLLMNNIQNMNLDLNSLNSINLNL